jgi:hypothetical protein
MSCIFIEETNKQTNKQTHIQRKILKHNLGASLETENGSWKQNASNEVTSSSSGKEIPCLLWKLNAHSRVLIISHCSHSQTPESIPFPLTLYFCKIHSTIILPSTPVSQVVFSLKFVCFISPVRTACPAHLIYLDFLAIIKCTTRYKGLTTSMVSTENIKQMDAIIPAACQFVPQGNESGKENGRPITDFPRGTLGGNVRSCFPLCFVSGSRGVAVQWQGGTTTETFL